MEYLVSVEIHGKQHYVGTITGFGSDDAVFTYSESYLVLPGRTPISISLPL
ncbi:MAG: hypothetical protein J1E60_02470 [Christensenellaceae bacterium]|nr:hypothetical protein [Christensenellaceae bacterium]